MRTNGSAAGVVTSNRKKETIPRRTASAVVPRRGSSRVPRHATYAVAPASTSVQRRIDPASAAHRLMTVKKRGVSRALFSATYWTEKSCVMSAPSIASTAPTTSTSASSADQRAEASARPSRFEAAYTAAPAPQIATGSAARSAALPRSAQLTTTHRGRACGPADGVRASRRVVHRCLARARRRVLLVVLRDHARRAERYVLGELALDHGAGVLLQECRRCAAADHRDIRCGIADAEHELSRLRVVFQRPGKNEAAEANGCPRSDVAGKRLGVREGGNGAAGQDVRRPE